MVHSSQWKLRAHAGFYRTPDAVYRVEPQKDPTMITGRRQREDAQGWEERQVA